MDKKLILTAIFLVFMIMSGFWLSRSGRPLNLFVLTVHKLISVAAFIYLGISAYRIHQSAPLSPVAIVVSAVVVLIFLVLIATGGLLSSTRTFPAFVNKTHLILPYFLILSTAVNLYILKA